MKDKILYLEKKYGSKKAAAKALGITERHFYRLLDGEINNKTLEKLVNILAAT